MKKLTLQELFDILPDGWIAKDKGDSTLWFFYHSRPKTRLDNCGWLPSDGSNDPHKGGSKFIGMLNVDWPEVEWRESLMQVRHSQQLPSFQVHAVIDKDENQMTYTSTNTLTGSVRVDKFNLEEDELEENSEKKLIKVIWDDHGLFGISDDEIEERKSNWYTEEDVRHSFSRVRFEQVTVGYKIFETDKDLIVANSKYHEPEEWKEPRYFGMMRIIKSCILSITEI